METIDLTAGRLEYKWVRGAASSPVTLVFLHEGLGSAAMWGRFPDVLATATRCRALVYSRFGYGGSDPLPAPRTDRFMHDEALRVLPELLARLGVSAPILIGHSDGASIALIHAAAADLRGLILEAPHVFAESLTLEGVHTIKARFRDDDGFRATLSRYHPDAGRVVREWSDAWLAPSFRAWTIEHALSSIACPVLLLQARDDPYGSLEHVNRIERTVRSRVRTVVLPGEGHSPHRDCRARALGEMAGFIASLAAG